MERPQGIVLHLNSRAARRGIRAGMTYASALSLDPEFRASAVAPAAIDEARAALRKFFLARNMILETDEKEPGAFWVRLNFKSESRSETPPTRRFGRRGDTENFSEKNNKNDFLRDLCALCGEKESFNIMGFRAAVAMGFTRFGSFAAARSLPVSRKEPLIFEKIEEERAFVAAIPIAKIFAVVPGRRSESIETLKLLGVRTVGEFLALPAGGILERFGQNAHRLHCLASGGAEWKLRAEIDRPPFARRTVLDQPDDNLTSLLFRSKALIDEVLRDLAGESFVLSSFRAEYLCENGSRIIARIAPARPSNDAKMLAELLYLRISTLKFCSAVEEIEVIAEPASSTHEQEKLFQSATQRDRRAAEESFARIRAEWGEDAVRVIALRDEHFPEEKIVMIGAEKLVWPDASALALASEAVDPDRAVLVRRWFRPAITLAADSFERIAGPFALSGRWWDSHSAPRRRRYYFARSRADRSILWIYRDEIAERWFMEGRVE